MHLSHPIRYASILLVLALALCATIARKPETQVFANGLYLVRLPVVTKMSGSNTLPTPLPGTPPEQLALERVNAYRALVGVVSVAPHAALQDAAQHHAAYTILNNGDASAWTNGPHGEVAGKPGFTGATFGDRVLAARFPYPASAEVLQARKVLRDVSIRTNE